MAVMTGFLIMMMFIAELVMRIGMLVIAFFY